ncbi:MAG: hypothetical protein JNK11_16205 [Alphaproteobacteria bacterium]|nr:hypothetical protein [Alphaproteobacteria bacterium]
MLRSEAFIPRSRPESNGMLSWRCAADERAGVGGVRILLLLDEVIVQGASSEPDLDEETVQIAQR